MSVLHHGDCLEVMAAMEAGSVDAVVTDPPYGLEFMGKEWDRLGGDAGMSKPGIGSRQTEWPSFGGAEFGGANPTCAVCGGRLRGAKKCSCESPDWRVKGKPTNGFRRRLNPSDVERDSVFGRSSRTSPQFNAGIAAQDWHQAWAAEALRVLKPSHYLLAFGGTRTWHRLACALEDAGFEIRDTLMWLYGSGFPKGTACLKPAWEPIILARKPGPKRALGIEECRIGFSGDADEREAKDKNRHADFGSGPRDNQVLGADNRDRASQGNYDSPGRYPANLILDEEAGALLDGQTRTLTSGKVRGLFVGKVEQSVALGDKRAMIRPESVYADSGGPSRFFYCAKASRKERNAGLEGMEEREKIYRATANGTGEVSKGMERFSSHMQNHHPTVKPLTLMRWLVKLVAYPGDTVLDPFMGSGTTGVACAMEGRKFIGIEREVEYIEIARRRIEAASAQERLPI